MITAHVQRGALALSPQSPLQRLIASQDLPCCTLVACWAMAVADLIPDRPLDLESWRVCVGREWWAAANVWDGADRWSSTRAIHELLGGTRSEVSQPGGFPRLAAGGWHVIQSWRPDYFAGHTYLVHVGRGGLRQVQSSVRLGYRDQSVATVPLRPLRLHQVLTLPADV